MRRPAVTGARVLLYLQRRPASATLREALASLGVEVRVAASFQELSALLVCRGDRTVLLLDPPEVSTFRRAVLESIGRLAPSLPVVAVVAALTAEVEQELANERVVGFIAADATPDEIIGELTRVLRSALTRGPPEEPHGERDVL